MRTQKPFIIGLMIFAAIFATGCNKLEPELGGFHAAKRKWEKEGSGDYSYLFRTTAVFGDITLVRVVVRNGAVMELLDPISLTTAFYPGDSVPMFERNTYAFIAIDAWFERIETDSRNYKLDLSFNDDFGYPNKITYVDTEDGDSWRWNYITDYQPQ